MRRRRLRIWVRQREDRRGRPWYCQWELPGGGRDTKTFGPGRVGEGAAREFAAQRELENAQAGGGTPTHDPRITVGKFAEWWLAAAAGGLKPRTRAGYADMLERHVLPALGRETRMRDVTPQDGVAVLAGMLQSTAARPAYAVGTVRHAYATARRMFRKAVFERVVRENPFAGIWHELPISIKKRVQGRRRAKEDVKAMTEQELRALLTASRNVGTSEGRTIHTPFHRDYVLFLLMARTGLRLGEACALKLDDVDLEGADLAVRQTLAAPKKDVTLASRLGTTKGDRERIVDLSPEAVTALRHHVAERNAQNLRMGWSRDRSPWLFATPAEGTPLSEFNVRRSFRVVLKRAELSAHFTPHCLRHTFATLALMKGASLLWVQKMLGHSTPEITLVWYAWALPESDKKYSALMDGAPLAAVAAASGSDSTSTSEGSEGTSRVSGDAPKAGGVAGTPNSLIGRGPVAEAVAPLTLSTTRTARGNFGSRKESATKSNQAVDSSSPSNDEES